ncbi:MAG TPA: hypothetical protein VMV92_02265 [Streptosporangiaceae bacterium]|nr:hypothetical protein [Streptosporangiaceae bacterium]
MSEVSWDSSEDIEAPTADALAQHQPLPGEDEEAEQPGELELPIEASEADAAEQHIEVDADDEDEYR